MGCQAEVEEAWKGSISGRHRRVCRGVDAYVDAYVGELGGEVEICLFHSVSWTI